MWNDPKLTHILLHVLSREARLVLMGRDSPMVLPIRQRTWEPGYIEWPAGVLQHPRILHFAVGTKPWLQDEPNASSSFYAAMWRRARSNQRR